VRFATATTLGIVVITGAVHSGVQDPIRIVITDPATTPIAPMPAGTGQIVGVTVDASTMRPLPGVPVSLSSRYPPVRVLSDGNGRFIFASLPATRFELSASLPGYAAGAHGRLRPSGDSLPIDLADSARASVTIPLWPLGAVAGVIVDERSEPLVGVRVQAYRRAAAAGRLQFVPAGDAATDDRGQYRIGGLEPGAYVVAVPMSSFSWPASLEHYMLQGAHYPDELQGLPDRTRELIGRGLAVTSKPPTVVQTISGAGTIWTTTDGRVATYGTQFFSGAATLAEATPIPIGVGEVRMGVDLALAPAATVTVSGTVTGPEGAVGDLVVSLTSEGTEVTSALSVTDGLGRFTFFGVSPGAYTVQVVNLPRGEPRTQPMMLTDVGLAPTSSVALTQPLSKEPALWGQRDITVGGTDLSGVLLTLRPGVRVIGRAEFMGAAAAPDAATLQRIVVALDRVDGGPTSLPTAGRGRIDADGRLATMGVPPGRYVVRVGGVPRGWFLQGAMLGARDLTSDPIDLTADATGVQLIFTDRPTGLSGTVSTASGAPDAAALVVLFPADPAAWRPAAAGPRRFRSGRTEANGAFSVSDMAPGEYFVAAIRDADAADWQSPERLAAIARSASRVAIAAGERATVVLRTIASGAR
jgi:hypothetical protein